MLIILLFIIFVATFLIGMGLLRTGLFRLSADTLKDWITKLTSTPLKGMIVGVVITAILQSSSAVMVITIGLIAAGLLKFPQTIGIILGTNIGTTFTAEFITFDIDPVLVPLAITGALLILLGRGLYKNLGFVFLGLSAVFIAMRAFEFIAQPLTEIPYIKLLLFSINESHLYGVIAGTILTAIIQSSTAVTGIAMGFLSGGITNLETGIAVMLGANIGTCLTAYLASIGAGREARITAYAHIWLNVIGVILFFPLIGALADFSAMAATEIDVQLAHASVFFNAISSLIVLPFAHQYANLILKIYDKKSA